MQGNPTRSIPLTAIVIVAVHFERPRHQNNSFLVSGNNALRCDGVITCPQSLAVKFLHADGDSS